MSPLVVRGATELAAKTDRIAGRLEQPAGAGARLSDILRARIRARFDAQGEGDWAAHAPATVERWGDHPILRATGALEAALTGGHADASGSQIRYAPAAPFYGAIVNVAPADHARRRRRARRPDRRRPRRARHGRRDMSAIPARRPAGSVYGPIVTGATVERAALATLRAHASRYIAETCRQEGRDPLPDPRGYIVASTFDKWPEDQLPVVVAISPGWAARPRRAGDGRTLVPWTLAAGIVTSAKPERTRENAQLYVAAIRTLARPAAIARRPRRRRRLHRRGLHPAVCVLAHPHPARGPGDVRRDRPRRLHLRRRRRPPLAPARPARPDRPAELADGQSAPRSG